jgi:hypothetical protein
MTELLYRLEPDELFAGFLGVATFISGLAIALGLIWASVRKAAITAELKRDMLDRGMSAQDIRVVIEAAPPNWCASAHWTPTETKVAR